MIRRIVFMAVAATLLAGVGLVSRPTQLDQSRLVVSGDVRVVTSPDGLTTSVSIDVDDGKYEPDGLVDHAFRLQHKAEQALAYDGEGTITFTGTSLRVEPKEGPAWVVVVAGKRTLMTSLDATDPWLDVIGLSHHWGSRTHLSHDEVAALLLASGCRMDEGDPNCENCEAGGPGVEGCGVECDEEEGCSAWCGGGGSFACCKCPAGCRCCPEKEAAPAASPVQH